MSICAAALRSKSKDISDLCIHTLAANLDGMQDLAGKGVVVVGASSGMGRATAQAAVAAGARVVASARNGAALEQLAAQQRAAGRDMLTVATDATQRAQVDHLLDSALQSLGRIDVLVNCVGTNIARRALSELSAADWAMMLDVNVTAAFHLTQAVMPVFRAQKDGLLIHISSSAARKADRSGIAYHAGKAGVAALAHGAMEEERENGVRVSVIYPGMTDTPLVLKRPTPPTPEVLARALQPEDVAAACVFLMALPPRAHVPELVLYPSRS
jgi:NADP-dependent 3-hydroxy acid dehydrogenase YdfG